MKPHLKIGLYGVNGHQIHHQSLIYPWAKIVATAAFPSSDLPSELSRDHSIRHYPSLAGLLSDQEVELVSICSPCRSKQAQEIITALRAGKHVLAEKPCAMNERDLDAILKTAQKAKKIFHEMSWTAFEEPYYSMRRLVLSGKIGEIVHVIAVKSYPYHENRPQDENIDGGLIGQSGIHAIRFIEHVACTPIQTIQAVETTLSNPVKKGALRMAASIALRLKNGGIASVSANYLNPKGTHIWGYESLQIFGSKGMVESTRSGKETRLVIGKKDYGCLKLAKSSYPTLLTSFYRQIRGKDSAWPLSLEEEFSPTRWVIRAKRSANKFPKL